MSGEPSNTSLSNKVASANNDMGVGSVVREEETYRWDTFKPSILFRCFNMVLQLVLVGALGSFLFGFNMSLLNTATKAINSSFLQCGDNFDPIERFNGVPEGKKTSAIATSYYGTVLSVYCIEWCEEYKECKEKCSIVNNGVQKVAECPSTWYGYLSLDSCKQNSECLKHCGFPRDETDLDQITKVRCPGGSNDIECSSLKWFNALLASSVLIGATIGALTGSRFLFIGRRTVLVVTMCIFVLGSICCTTSNSFSALFWGRLVVGYAVGLVSVASPTYMSEVTPKAKRGSYGVMHQLMIVVGIFIPMPLGLVLKDPEEQNDLWVPGTLQQFWWRFMLALGIVPTIVALYLLLFVYTFDTPVWYVEQRRFKDAASLLGLIYGREDVKEELDEIIQNVRQGEINKHNGMNFKKAFSDSEYRHVIFVGIALSAFQQFGGINVFMTSSSEIFKKAGLSGRMQTAMSIIMGAINVIMTFPTLFLIERMGRKMLMFLGSALQFLFIVPAAVMYWYDSNLGATKVLAVVAVLGFVMSFALAYGPVLWVYLFEIYPMEIKDVAAGVATAINWVAGVITVFVAVVLDIKVAFTLFAVLQLVATILIATLMKETKGRSLGDSPFITKHKNTL